MKLGVRVSGIRGLEYNRWGIMDGNWCVLYIKYITMKE